MPLFKPTARPLRFFRRAWSKFLGYPPLIKIALSCAIIVVLIFIYLALALLSLSRGEIALAALRLSYHEESVCRSACWERRAVLRKAVISELAERPQGRLFKRLRQHFLDDSEAAAWRAAVADIFQAAGGQNNPPDFLVDYAGQAGANPQLVARLVALFAPESLSSGEGAVNPLDYYFQQLQSGTSLEVAEAAISGISRYSDRTSGYRLEQLEILRQLVLAPDTDSRLRPALIMLLSEYYSLWPDEVSEILRLAYATSELDEISRAFSADLLNRFEPQGGPEGQDWPAPAVSSEAWFKYYER